MSASKSGPSEAFERGLAQILDTKGVTWGAGVAIDDKRVITCAHVVARAFGLAGSALEEQIKDYEGPWVRRPYLTSSGAEPVKMKVIGYWSSALPGDLSDLALLETADGSLFQGTGERNATPPGFDREGPRPGDVLLARGFPLDRKTAHSHIDEAEYETGHKTENGWVNLVAKRGFGSEIRGGFSGGPVWSERTQAVVGLTAEGDGTRRTALLIPVNVLRNAVSLPFPALETETHAQPDVIQQRETARPGLLRLLLDYMMPSFHLWLTTVARVFRDPAERVPIRSALGSMAANFEHSLVLRTYLPPPTRMSDPTPGEFRPVRQLIRAVTDISAGGDAATADISALSKHSRRVRKLVSLIEHSPVPLILLGDPGSGKSMTLQQVAIAFARKNERRVFPQYCLFIPLGSWIPDMSPSGPNEWTVERFVSSKCAPEVWPYLESLRDSSRLVVIFDGMDEMSRRRYVEHTKALDTYASKYRHWVRTLFSCRLADFSPNFQHRRLVLMRFEEKQVREYLRRQLHDRRIELNGTTYTMKQLARILVGDELAIQATNPYVLFLLCLYMRETRTLPDKRCDLLEFYYRFTFNRTHGKEEDAALDHTREFDLWGQIALEITKRNQGREIRSTEIERLMGADGEYAIRSGMRTGVLVRPPSVAHGAAVPLHFENHRAQEFFSAWSIARSDQPFDWTGLLDAPRWQETLVNVAQLGKASSAIDALVHSIERAPEESLAPQNAIERNFAMADVAERVDLATRVARDMPRSEERTRLLDAARKAVDWLLSNGTAYAKVTLLGTVQRTAEFSSMEMVEPVLRDKSQWVRAQALLVASRIAGSMSRAPLIAELVVAYANWQLLGRTPSYLKLAAQAKSPRLAATVMVGTLMLMLQACIFASVGPVSTFLVTKTAHGVLNAQGAQWQRLADDAKAPSKLRTYARKQVEKEPGGAAVFAVAGDIEYASQIAVPGSLAITVLAFLLILIKAPEKAWMLLPSIGLGAALAPLLLDALWRSAQSIDIGTIFGGATVVFGIALLVRLVLTAFGFIVWAIATTAFAGSIMLYTGSVREATAAWRTSLTEAEFRDVDWMASVGVAALSIVPWLVLMLALVAFDFFFHFDPLQALISHIPHLVHFKFLSEDGNLLLNAGLIALITAGAGGTTWKLATRKYADIPGLLAIIIGIAIAIAGGFAVFGVIGEYVLPYIFSLLPTSWIPYALKGLIIIILIGVVLALFAAVALLMRQVLLIVYWRYERWRRTPLDPAKWTASILRGNPATQAHLLSMAEPERFRLDIDKTLALITDLERSITTDPALSAYHAKVTELLKQRQQQRSG